MYCNIIISMETYCIYICTCYMYICTYTCTHTDTLHTHYTTRTCTHTQTYTHTIHIHIFVKTYHIYHIDLILLQVTIDDIQTCFVQHRTQLHSESRDTHSNNYNNLHIADILYSRWENSLTNLLLQKIWSG